MVAFATAPFSPCRAQSRAWAALRGAASVRTLAGALLLAAASRLQLPFLATFVPFTAQPQAVLWLAAAVGGRQACASILVWLGAAAMGAPVLSAVAAGPWALVGPSAGYLWSYLLVASIVGRCGRGHGMAAMLAWFAGAAVTLAMGTVWLSQFVGWSAALTMGLWPFWLGDAAKVSAAFLARRLLTRR